MPDTKTNLAKYLLRPISLRPPPQITRHSFGQRSAFSRLRISKFVVHQAWRAGQIIPQKYYKNEIELDHNFVVYEAFQILTQQNKERREEQIHRFVENFERIPNWNIQWGYKFCNLRAIWAALHNSIIKALFGDYRVLARSHRPFAFSFIWH